MHVLIASSLGDARRAASIAALTPLPQRSSLQAHAPESASSTAGSTGPDAEAARSRDVPPCRRSGAVSHLLERPQKAIALFVQQPRSVREK